MEIQKVQYIIDAEVVQAVGNYLSSRPWAEVHEVMPVLQNLEIYVPASTQGKEGEGSSITDNK